MMLQGCDFSLLSRQERLYDTIGTPVASSAGKAPRHCLLFP